MARTFRDPQEELEFIGQVEDELAHLNAEGVIGTECVRNATAHYEARRAELSSALAGGGRIFSAEAIAKRGTVSWVAWIGVAIVLAAALVFTEQAWGVLLRPGRLAVLMGFTVALSAGAWLLYGKLAMRKTGLAVLSAGEGMLLISIAYAFDMYGFFGHAGIGPADTTVILAFGAALFAATAWKLDEPWMFYVAAGLAVGATQAGIEWGLYTFRKPLDAYLFDQKQWDHITYVTGWYTLVCNTLASLLLIGAGWLYAVRRDWHHANPLVFSGVLWLIGTFAFIESSLLPGDYDGFIALALSIGLLWLGLARQKKALAIAATVGFTAALVRVEGEFFDDFASRSATLAVLGLALIVAAVLFERRRKEILGRLGEWQ